MAAKAKKDPKTGKWLIQFRYTDWQGTRRKSTKRGFKTKRDAEAWLQNFLVMEQSDFNMLFEDFVKIYYADMETRLREHTMRTKKYNTNKNKQENHDANSIEMSLNNPRKSRIIVKSMVLGFFYAH